MPADRADLAATLGAIVTAQDGVVARHQLLAVGLPAERIRQEVRAGRWRRVHRGVYACHTGPLPPRARVWAAVLACGPGAAAGGRTALWLAGVRLTERLADRALGPIEVVVPRGRDVDTPSGVRVARRRLPADAVLATSPPRLRLEAAVTDVADLASSVGDVVGLVTAVVQQRFTTAERLRAELATRSRHRYRRLLTDLLADVQDGVRSPLELRYRRIERAHGLPAGEYNPLEHDEEGRSRYPDVRYLGGRVVVELDGRAAHPLWEAFRDRRRDNAGALAGRITLRYGWTEIAAEECAVAAQVASALVGAGWSGRPRACGPGCPVGADIGQGSWRLEA